MEAIINCNKSNQKKQGTEPVFVSKITLVQNGPIAETTRSENSARETSAGASKFETNSKSLKIQNVLDIRVLEIRNCFVLRI